jgi:hypothetical protein
MMIGACLRTSALVAASAAAAHAQDILVVAPDDLAPAAAEWTSYREGQGRKVLVRAPGDDPAAVVRDVHGNGGRGLRFVLLLGDVDRVPCAFRPVVATAKWESDTRIATDAPIADLDGDGVPDVAIGRLPARDAAEARALLGRSIAYERDRDFGDWRRRVHVLAGTGGFGPLQDAALEQMTKQFLTRLVPPGIVVHATYGNPFSAWCPEPATFSATVLERVNEGSLVVAYIGHGSPTELDSIRFGKERFPIFGASEAARTDVRRGAPIAVFIACSTGKFDGKEDSLAETLLRRPRGPVAVVASSRVSTPYANGILSKEMLDVLFAAGAPTAGELLLEMKRRLVRSPEDESRRQIESLAASFYDADPARREADRAEHLALYNLLGDPCLRIARPTPFDVEAPATAAPGAKVVVTGASPVAGTAIVELARRRDAAVSIGRRTTPEEWRAVYENANRQEVAATRLDVPAGTFRAEVVLPPDAKPGAYCVRVFVEGKDGAAVGGRAFDVHVPKGSAAPAPGDGR